MQTRKLFVPILLTFTTAACAPAMPVTPSLSNDPGTASQLQIANRVMVQIDTGAALQTLAAKKTVANIDHYHLKLVDADTGTVIAEGDSNGLTSHFDNVPNGTYRLIADAIDADGNSIVQGGEQTSVNTVTVNSPNVTYSDGSPCLKVTLHLLDATGETIGNKVHVVDGQDWTGPANLVDGGDCPCPSASSPSPSPSPNEAGSELRRYAIPNPYAIAMDPSGNAWVTTFNIHTSLPGPISQVSKLSPEGDVLGSYTTGSWPTSVAIDPSGNVWVANMSNNTVTRLAPDGTLLGNISSNWPEGVTIDANGTAWVTDNTNNVLRTYSPTGELLNTYVVGPHNTITVGLTFDQLGNGWVQNGEGTITKIAPDGTTLGTFSLGDGNGGGHFPPAIDNDGNVWVTEMSRGVVIKMAPDGTILGTYSSVPYPTNVAVDSQGRAWITNQHDNTVTALSSSGTVLGTYTIDAGPAGIAIDSQGNVWVACNDANAVVVLSGGGHPAAS